MTAAQTIAWALSQKGTTEKPPGSNKIEYWREIGLDYLNGFEWCGTFSYDAMDHGRADLSWTTPRRFVDTVAGLADAKAAGIFYTGTPNPGDPVWFNFDSDPSPEHVGIVIAAIGDRVHIRTIEGNVTDRVVTLTRSTAQVIGYARITYHQEDDMDLNTKIDLADGGFAEDEFARWGDPKDVITVGQAMQWQLAFQLRTLRTLAAIQAQKIDYEALADKIAERLPDATTIDGAIFASDIIQGVADELHARLGRQEAP
jgi:hypothetical protein